MHPKVAIVAFAACAIAAPEPVEKRQDVSQLLGLASLAGITALPTNPALLISLGPLAISLASELPTSPVLSVLETAAPSGFVSEILHNPSYASSFEAAFAAGSSPSWFNNLPTSVKSYLHTYSNYGGIATAVAALNSINANGSATQTTGGLSSTGSASSATGSATGTSTTSGSMSNSASTTGSVSAGQSSIPTSSTTATTNAAPGLSGAFAAGCVGMLGVMGLVAAL